MIASYTDLQNAVVEYAARDQDITFTSRVPTFVQLFESKMNRNLFVRQMEQRSTALTDITSAEPQYVALPPDFQSMRRLRITGGAQYGVPFLTFKSNQQMDDYKYQTGDVADQPLYFTIFGNELELGPTPDADYTLEMVYRQNIPPLAMAGTNWLLTLAPDLYLYGALLESAPYIKEDERLQTWGTLYDAALNDLNELGKLSAFNAGPMTVRPAGIATW